MTSRSKSTRPRTSDGPRHQGRKQAAPSVVRAAQLLSTLASDPRDASLAALARRLEIAPSSTLALCNALLAAGLLQRREDGDYRLGPQVLELSRGYLAQTDLPAEFERWSRTNVLPEETIVLSVLDGNDVVYVSRRQGSRSVSVSYELGLRLPAHCTASGKAILSCVSEDAIRGRYADRRGAKLTALTPSSITRLEDLLADLSVARARGYAVDDEETAVGMTCVGAPIRDLAQEPVGAVAASMVKAGLTSDDLDRIAQSIRDLAERISTGLGANGEPGSI